MASRFSRAAWNSLPWLAPLGFLALFYFYPLGSILQMSFGRGQAGLTGAARLAAPLQGPAGCSCNLS